MQKPLIIQYVIHLAITFMLFRTASFRYFGHCLQKLPIPFLFKTLFQVYINKYSPSLSVRGYMVALVTAALRLYERKHWLSDIIAGAIIGIVSARLSQLIYDQPFDDRYV